MCDLPVLDEIYKEPNHKTSLLYGAFSLYQRKRFCDVQITVNAKKLFAHGVILASSSDFFNSKLEELPQNGTMMDIFLDGVDDVATSTMIDYYYVGEIKLQRDTVLNVIQAAGLFQNNSIVKACCSFMEKALDKSNCLNFLEIGELFGCEDLRIKAEKFISQNMNEVVKTGEFKKITVRQLENILKMNLNVSSENDVFKWVESWVKHDLPDRKQHLVSLLKIVRLPLLSAEMLLDKVQPLCDNDITCRDLVTQALRMSLIPDKKNSPSEYWNVPRTRNSTVLLSGSLKKETTKSLLIYDPKNDSWKEYLNTGIERWNACSALVGDELFVIGGVDDTAIVATVETVNLKTGKKKTVAPLQTARFCAVAAVVNENIYVFGGTDNTKTLNSVEKWDPVSQSWTYVTQMITGREGCAIGVLDNEIYIIGGWNRRRKDGEGLKTVEAFCPNTEQWRVCLSLGMGRHWVSASVINRKLYVLGGRRGETMFEVNSSVEEYDPEKDKWSFIPSLIFARYGSSAGALDFELIMAGGANNGDTDRVEKFDFSQHKWISMKPLPQHRENGTMFTVPIDWLKRNVTLN